MADTKPTTNLATKLSSIMGELGSVEKKGFNKAQNYRFVRESDVVAALVPLLAKNKIMLRQSVVSSNREPLYQTNSGLTMWLTRCIVEFQWLDGETGEILETVTVPGEGADTGDKGIYKAMTGAEKYFLMKTFLISTGDDPEADEKVDKAVAASAAKEGPKVVRGKQEGVQRGGRSGIATAAQVNAIANLARELGLDAEGVMAVGNKVTGKVPGDAGPRDYFARMSSEEAGAVIAALSERPSEDVGETTAEEAEETSQPDLAIV